MLEVTVFTLFTLPHITKGKFGMLGFTWNTNTCAMLGYIPS